MGNKRHNAEKRAWRGKSYKKGGERVRSLREEAGSRKAKTQAGAPRQG
jgi:hypothetical protein